MASRKSDDGPRRAGSRAVSRATAQHIAETQVVVGDRNFSVKLDRNVLSWNEWYDEADASSNGVGEARAMPLRSGSCNLYMFPRASKTGEEAPNIWAKATSASDDLDLMRQLILALASSTNAMSTHDDVGAHPVHALMVCNSAASLALALDLFEAQPQLLQQTHAGSSTEHVPH